MQLKIQRSQRDGGVLGNTVFFCLDIRAEYSPEEKDNIDRYKLGRQVIYNSTRAKKHLLNATVHGIRAQSSDMERAAGGALKMLGSLALAKLSLNVSIASLGRGHHIECKDLEELVETEDTLREASKYLTRWLDVAATFNGSETIIEYDKGEEQLRIAPNAAPLLAYEGASGGTPMLEHAGGQAEDRDRPGAGWWHRIEARILAFAEDQGWYPSQLQVRAACGFSAILVLFLVVHYA
jgi:hypothetical protein